MNLGIIILAAGNSSRMGVPKQLLDIHGVSLLRRVIDNALLIKDANVTVVLGANKEIILPTLAELPIGIIENKNWEAGMSSSIKMGMAGAYMVNKQIDNVLIMAGDMPSVNENHLMEIIENASKSEFNIIASSYQKTLGIPCLFKRPLFHELLELKGDKGASFLIKNHIETVVKVPLGKESIDIDTKEDYFNYLNSQN